MATVDRGFGRWRRAAPDIVAVSGRPLRGVAGGLLDRPPDAVAVAVAQAAQVGGVLAGSGAVARVTAGPILADAAGGERQGEGLGSGSVRAGRLPPAGARQRMAPAP